MWKFWGILEVKYEEFLSLSKPENYNFIEEIAYEHQNLHFLLRESSNMKKYLLYGLSSADCDRLDLSLKIYKKLWENQGIDFGHQWVQSNGETMNSFQTSYNWYLRYNERDKEVEAGFEEFALRTNTIGNFLPVPVVETKKGWKSTFNSPRYSVTKDYWDITMKQIRDYFSDNKDELKYIKDSTNWLASFGNWKSFVEKNYLEDFVDKNGKPIEFWEGHFTGKLLPQNNDELKSFF